jgi:hypothetical protein
MPERSIHFQRRWFYVLWCVLLFASLAAFAAWETPSRRELGALDVAIDVRDVPAGTRAQAWEGPRKAWRAAWNGEGAWADLVLAKEGPTPLPRTRLAIARRRWVHDYIPRGTWDLVIVRLTPPSGPARYLVLDCSKDIRAGVIRKGFRLKVVISGVWSHLPVDAEAFLRVP